MLNIPQNWRALAPDHKLAQMTRRVLQEARERGWLMPTPGYDIDLYTFSSRRLWGQARSERATVTKRYLRHAVGLNRLFLTEPDKALTTICHEVAHCCCPSDKHGAQWYQIASALATKFNAPHQITVQTSQKQVGIKFGPIQQREYKYVAQCPSCRHEWGYKRVCKVIKSPDRYRCPYCSKQGLAIIKPEDSVKFSTKVAQQA